MIRLILAVCAGLGAAGCGAAMSGSGAVALVGGTVAFVLTASL